LKLVDYLLELLRRAAAAAVSAKSAPVGNDERSPS
jgi:hypothetical protein